MKYGVQISVVDNTGEPGQLELVRCAEELGLDSVWTGEHIMFHVPCLDSLASAGVYLGATSRVRVGTAVTLLPFRHPLVLAKAVTTLDVLSGGRFMLGVGVGGEFRAELEACGIPYSKRGRIADETLESLHAVWGKQAQDGGGASFQGEFFQFADVAQRPSPVQQPHPPIYVGGRTEAAERRVARYGTGWIPYVVAPATYRVQKQRIQSLMKEKGREADLHGFDWGLLVFVNLGESSEDARKDMIEALATRYHQDFSPLVDRYCVFGTPEECARRLSDFAEAGVEHFILAPTSLKSDAVSVLRAYKDKVLPLVNCHQPRTA